MSIGNWPPEWLATTSAPPDGKQSRPCTSDRKYVFNTGRITLISRLVRPGSHLPCSWSSLSVLTFLLRGFFEGSAVECLDGSDRGWQRYDGVAGESPACLL